MKTPEKKTLSMKKYYQQHKEHLKEYAKEYKKKKYQENPNFYKECYMKKQEYYKQKSREYRKIKSQDPNYRKKLYQIQKKRPSYIMYRKSERFKNMSKKRYWTLGIGQLKLKAMNVVCNSQDIRCKNCGCRDIRILEIHHINHDGYKDRKKYKIKYENFYIDIINGKRQTNDLTILCKLCNTKTYLEQKFGLLFDVKIIDESSNPYKNIKLLLNF